ncbi:MAG: hypothetical protein KatS3mg111_2579 [Pirellulaceae bacterium]|nr:MAG: hypothetical protein KatS3mg111_2579 [Pirellulaceae bacterium]
MLERAGGGMSNMISPPGEAAHETGGRQHAEPAARTAATVDDRLVVLPPELRERLEGRGYQSPVPVESRAWARLTVMREARLSMVHTPPALHSALPWPPHGRVIVKDLSRSGIGFFFHMPLFPSQQIQIQLSHYVIQAKVRRCRRHTSDCYELGAIVTQVRSSKEDRSADYMEGCASSSVRP